MIKKKKRNSFPPTSGRHYYQPLIFDQDSEPVPEIRLVHIFFFKQKTAYEVSIGDWSSDVCSSDPAMLGDRMRGKTCAGTVVTGKRKDGGDGAVYLCHVADNERTMREYGHQAVVLQTALNPVVALELLAAGTWEGTGVLGPESFPPDPFLELLADYGEPH